MNENIKNIFQESSTVCKAAIEDNMDAITRCVEIISQSIQNGGKVILFGNGGSAADSQHIAAEFIGRFQKERRSLPAIALTTDTSALTAIGNDYGFDSIFARQLEGLGVEGDVAIGISTSGNSKNVVEAIKTAREKKLKTIVLTGSGGGALAPLSDVKIMVPSAKTARVQEAHILVAHAICELVEDGLS